ncbi:KUP/HAK/KT family potassium transporter [Nitrosomonas communis]|nr:KUP/HAK/KT family potassium transporter [Nitrosomonas communis]
MKEAFSGAHALPPEPQNVLGMLSLIFWALIAMTQRSGKDNSRLRYGH